MEHHSLVLWNLSAECHCFQWVCCVSFPEAIKRHWATRRASQALHSSLLVVEHFIVSL